MNSLFASIVKYSLVCLSVSDPGATDTSTVKDSEEKSEESPKEEAKPVEGAETKEVKGRKAWLYKLVALPGF